MGGDQTEVGMGFLALGIGLVLMGTAAIIRSVNNGEKNKGINHSIVHHSILLLGVSPIRNQPFNCIFERSERPDLETSVLGAEREESCVVKFFKWTKNGYLVVRKGLTKFGELSCQIPNVGYRHYCLRLSSV